MNNDRHYASIEFLRAKGIDLSKDYFELSGYEVSEVLAAAKLAKYRKSRARKTDKRPEYIDHMRRELVKATIT